MKTLFLTLTTILSIHSASAAFSGDLLKDIPDSLREAKIRELTHSEFITIKAAGSYGAYYANPIFLEVEVTNLNPVKEFYLVNRSNTEQSNNRNTKVEFLSERQNRDWQHGYSNSGMAQAMYVGAGSNHTSRFIILSPGISPNTYISLYVKMNGEQYSTTFEVKGREY